MNKTVIAGVLAGILLAGVAVLSLGGGLGFVAQAQQMTGNTKSVTLIAIEKQVQVAPDNILHPGGIMYNAMTFNGTIPGPVISVDQGDKVMITLINQGKNIHSLDFHAGVGPTHALSGSVKPNQSKTWELDAVSAGAFLYHCGADGLNGVWEHMANGMYGGIVVHPANEAPAKEFYMVFSDLYNNADHGLFKGTGGKVGSFDVGKLVNEQPDLILTNGMAHKYVPAIGTVSKIVLNPNAQVFKVKPGELTRWYVVNPGTDSYVAFHFIAGQLTVKDGSVMNRYGTIVRNDETWTIPPGSASVIEATFPDPGVYVGVDHNMSHVLKGAAFAVVADPASTNGDQPVGTAVPPKGSNQVSNGMAANMTGMNGNMMMSGGSNSTGSTSGSNMTSGSNSTGITGGNMTSTSGNAVSIMPGAQNLGDKAFSPNPISVKVGDKVTWTNTDTAIHTVTSGDGTTGTADGTFDSKVLQPKSSYSFTFTKAGTYKYFCQLHPTMLGTVNVS